MLPNHTGTADHGAASETVPDAPDSVVRPDAPNTVWFLALLFGLCAAYFTIELIYIARFPLVMDEFAGARAVSTLRTATPYADFTPYKTVLGYYLQLPSMLLGGGDWTQMLRIKREMAVIAALAIFGAGVLMARSFRRDASLLAVAAWVCVSCFLERSAEIRVDMLTGLAGLFAFLLVLRRKPAWAGLVAALSFMISQKGAYFCVAGGMAFGSYFLAVDRSWRTFREAAAFGFATLAALGLYVLVFGGISSFDAVMQPTFSTAAGIATDVGVYKHLREYWFQTTMRNPYFYAVAMLGVGAAFEAGRRNRSFRDWAVFAFGGSFTFLALWHSQPWPYFFTMVVPPLVVCAAFFFDRISRSGRSAMFWVLFISMGMAFPLNRVSTALERNNDYQRYSVGLAKALLGKHDTYLAGVDMVFSRKQSPSDMAWLDVAREAAIRKRPASSILDLLGAHPPKLLLQNYRLRHLPTPVRTYLRRNYRHFSAAIWLYSPMIEQPEFNLGYSGSYQVVARSGFLLDGNPVRPGQLLTLSAGQHTTDGGKFSLRFVPRASVLARVKPEFAREQNLFPAIYDW